MSFKAALEALTQDAAVWSDVSKVTGSAAQKAESLSLGEADLSWASHPTGLLDTYAEIQAKVARLLREGATVYDDLSVTLIDVRNQYQASDETAARKLEGVWDIRE